VTQPLLDDSLHGRATAASVAATPEAGVRVQRPAQGPGGPGSSTRPNTQDPSPYAHLLRPANGPGSANALHIPDSEFDADNSADNPWARPMTREVAEQHEQAKALMGQMGIPEQFHEQTIRTGMPGTFAIAERKAGDVTHSRKSVAAAHGRYTSPIPVSREDSVQGHALAWAGTGASREDQHGQASTWVHGSDTPTQILTSTAAPQVHRGTGELLPGGLPQEFQPRGFLASGVVKSSIIDKLMATTRARRAAAHPD